MLACTLGQPTAERSLAVGQLSCVQRRSGGDLNCLLAVLCDAVVALSSLTSAVLVCDVAMPAFAVECRSLHSTVWLHEDFLHFVSLPLQPRRPWIRASKVAWTPVQRLPCLCNHRRSSNECRAFAAIDTFLASAMPLQPFFPLRTAMAFLSKVYTEAGIICMYVIP
jgi:hypothetical protein